MNIDRSTTEAVEFRRVYQGIVDRTPVARDLEDLEVHALMPGAAMRRGWNRNWVAAVVGAATMVLAVGGVVALLNGGSGPSGVADGVQASGPYVVVGDIESLLGSNAEIISSTVSTIDAGAPSTSVQLQLWEHQSGTQPAASVAVLESNVDDELTYVAAPSARGVGDDPEIIERNGVSFVLLKADSPDAAIGLEWTDSAGENKYLVITQGVDLETAIDIASSTAAQGGDATGATPENLTLTYQGSQLITPPPGTIVRALTYGGDAGTLQVTSLEGWTLPESAWRLRSVVYRLVNIDARPGLLISDDGLEWGVTWTDGIDVTYMVASTDLSQDQVVEAARQVIPISAEQWNAMAVNRSPSVADAPAALTSEGDLRPGETSIDFGDASEFQQPFLEDGLVTFSEYEEAYLAAVQCTSDQGAVVEQLELAPDGVQYLVVFDETPVEGVPVGQIWEDCRQQYSEYVEIMYIDGVATSLDEILAELQEIADCLEDLGLEVTDPTSPSHLVQVANTLPESKTTCFPPSFFGGINP